MQLFLAFVIGLIVGRAVHLATPRLLRLKDPAAPFAWPWVELAGAVLFVVLETRGAVAPTRLGAFVFVTLLLAVSAADLRAKLIPDLLTFSGTLVGVVWNAFRPQAIHDFLGQHELLMLFPLPREITPWGGLALAIAGAVLGFVLLEGFRRMVAVVARVEGMGMGDAKLLMMIGAFMGPHAVLLTLLPACLAGAAVGLVHRWRSGQPHVVFGPALAFGAVVVLVAGGPLQDVVWRGSLALLELPRAVVATFYGLLLGLLVAVLVLLRRRAERYEQMLEDDYRSIEEELRDD